ncbi:hypothetical protein RJ639_043739 [Escallonia herrerae]|uniref:Uncharacterized protein n=1 Tax=Escallonia herrerae TaxID=1293975 RepID=A0AA88WAU9_9ASTE|nr:hypothetical protein RJ639_043739 [Escallonia herrerae]
MGRAPCCSKVGLHRGAWSVQEDRLLTDFIQAHGESQWRSLPSRAGLLRCGKNCRLRWKNYLRPDIKRGNFALDEEDLIIRLHSLLGNRWALIAGRLPGRTDNEIKNHWNTHLSKRLPNSHETTNVPKLAEKPKPRKKPSSNSTTTKRTEEERRNTSISGSSDGVKINESTKISIPAVAFTNNTNDSDNVVSRFSSTSKEEVDTNVWDVFWPSFNLEETNGGDHLDILLSDCDLSVQRSLLSTVHADLVKLYYEYLHLL